MRGYLAGLITITKPNQESNLSQNQVIKKRINSTESKNQYVFIVHGHDDEAKETVARVIEKLGLKVIILHEQPELGRTIIEKLEFNSNVSFAIVLLTPDDVGAKSGSGSRNPRSRQNVVFELGYFIAKLGRERVFVLCKGDIEIPSDYHGVIYTSIDKEGGWRFRLARNRRLLD